jgi:transposase
VRSALEWAQVRRLAADGVSEREIARRLGMNRRTVARLARSVEPPRYRRAPAGSQLDQFEPVLRRLLEEWPQIKAPRVTEILREEYGYAGSERLVRLHLQRLRPARVRPAQRTGYRPGQVLQLDWAEMPTRPAIEGRERRVDALVASLPYSGAQTAFCSFEMTIEAFMEGHVRAFEWLGGVPRECVYDNLRSVVARREGEQVVVWNPRFLHLRGHYGFHAHPCTPARPRGKGSVEAAVRFLKTSFWPARRIGSLGELDEQ